jgi:predicted pyridoxine 5'-phosphate oxidase superfamily flavin-nucleotide-binding protein
MAPGLPSHFPTVRHLKDVTFHSGEREVQARAGVADEARDVGRIIGRTVTPPVARFLARQRLAVAASLDAEGRVWASLLAGPAGFLSTADPSHVHIAGAPIPGDPLGSNLSARPELGLLVIDPQTRQRMRFNGRGRLSAEGLSLDLQQVYGNCPKYIQLREALGDGLVAPEAPRVSSHLDARQRATIGNADTLFIASFHPEGGADASHRGGFPGFVRVLEDGQLVFPDYPGNAMFNTLGNLAGYPQAGLLFVDFATGDVLQVSGRARLERDFSVRMDVDEVRETRAASPLRFRLVEYSPAIDAVTR